MDFNAIAEQVDQTSEVGAIISNRTLQADVDFFCHAVAYTENSIESNYKALLRKVEHARKVSRSGAVNIHITLGLKGGRNEIATVQPYQDNRKKDPNPARTERVKQLRAKLAFDKTLPSYMKVIADMTQEADDTLRQYQESSIRDNGLESTILISGDKDLWFSNGYHCDPDTGRVWLVDGYGKCSYQDVGNEKPKLIGVGTSFFWHQMIMGDKVDGIPGLPKLSGRLANVYIPTKKLNPNRPALACGEAKAVAMLKDVTTDAEALRRVEEAYYDHYGAEYKERIVEQAYLLWIRATNKVTEVIDMLNTHGKGYEFSEKQKDLLRGYFATVKQQNELRAAALANC